MGKYFGREMRFSRAEIERQAQEAIDARVSLGRPPAEDWAPVHARLAELDRAELDRAELDRATAAHPPLPHTVPLRVHEIRIPLGVAPAGTASRAPVVAARQ